MSIERTPTGLIHRLDDSKRVYRAGKSAKPLDPESRYAEYLNFLRTQSCADTQMIAAYMRTTTHQTKAAMQWLRERGYAVVIEKRLGKYKQMVNVWKAADGHFGM